MSKSEVDTLAHNPTRLPIIAALFALSALWGSLGACAQAQTASHVFAPPVSAAIDARTTPAGERAPIVHDPSSLPDFALFRECAGCPEMVILPAGVFLMGSVATESGRAENEDSQAGPGGAQVVVSVGRFALSRFETTWDEWEACVAAEVCQQRSDSGFGRGRRPAINVDWQTDARAFIDFVNMSASGYRLPSEAEWEYAARAGTTTTFPWGAYASHDHANYGSDACCSGLASGRDQWEETAPVGQFPANAFGLYDMHGNVTEWVADCYRDNLLAQTAAPYTEGRCSTRIVRGGAWYDYPVILRTAYRAARYPREGAAGRGFRLARSL